MLTSDYRPLCEVRLPYAARQRYMHSFDLAAPIMAHGFEDYLEPVSALCKAAGALSGIAHMTVDEKIIAAGATQRKPRPHVDGQFVPLLNRWSHGPGGGWNHYCNNVPLARMPIIVAASVAGCRVWRGAFNGHPKDDGDCSHIELGAGEIVPADTGYLLTPDCIHESLPFDRPTQRTFLRIALPVTFHDTHPLSRDFSS